MFVPGLLVGTGVIAEADIFHNLDFYKYQCKVGNYKLIDILLKYTCDKTVKITNLIV